MNNTELIVKLIEEQDKTRELQIKGVQKAMTAGFDAIAIQDQKRNGRIENLEKETTETRWIHRNPKMAIAAFLIILSGLFYGYHKIDFKRVAENKGIYIKDNSTHTVERGRR